MFGQSRLITHSSVLDMRLPEHTSHRPSINRLLPGSWLVREIQPFCWKNASSSEIMAALKSLCSYLFSAGAVTAVGGSYLFRELMGADQNDNYDGFAVGGHLCRKKEEETRRICTQSGLDFRARNDFVRLHLERAGTA